MGSGGVRRSLTIRVRPQIMRTPQISPTYVRFAGIHDDSSWVQASHGARLDPTGRGMPGRQRRAGARQLCTGNRTYTTDFRHLGTVSGTWLQNP